MNALSQFFPTGDFAFVALHSKFDDHYLGTSSAAWIVQLRRLARLQQDPPWLETLRAALAHFGEAILPELSAALRLKSSAVCREVLLAAVEMGTPGFALFRQALEHPQAAVRSMALKMLPLAYEGSAHCSTETSQTEIYLAFLHDPAAIVRCAAVTMLARHGDRQLAKRHLPKLLQDDDLFVQLTAAARLAGLYQSGSEYEALFCRALAHVDSEVRLYALRQLHGRCFTPAVQDLLLNLLRDSNPPVRAAAIGAAKFAPTRETVSELRKIMRRDPSKEMRAAAEQVLAMMDSSSFCL